MFKRSWRMVMGVAVGFLGFGQTGIADSDSGILSLPDRTFVHLESRTALRVPVGWETAAPFRLRKTATSTVFGLESDRTSSNHIAVTIIWSPLTRKWDEVIRATAEENRGDEYATLVSVYGKSKIDRPTTMKVGKFTVYKVLIDAGPEKDDAGALYMFETGQGGNRWMVRIRAVFPQLNREENIKRVEQVLSSFFEAAEVIEIEKTPK